MAVRIDQFSLGTEQWSVGIDGGLQLKLFGTHPCFMVLVSLRNGLEVDRGYITSGVIPKLVSAQRQAELSSLNTAGSSLAFKMFTLISLQESVALKIYKSRVGSVGIQLVDFEATERAVSWKGPDEKLQELAKIIRDRSWASPLYFG